ncbi:MAG TPA: hypothetical protein VFZ70_00855 [Euzebyales bacterium]
MATTLRAVLVAVVPLMLVGCGQSTGDDGADAGADASPAAAPTASQSVAAQRHPDIVEVEITPAGEQTFDLAVTVSSPYDTPDRYADGWRVLTPDGTELATHTLMHDHAGEQPFTRTQTGVEIPPDVGRVTVEGRDQRYGFGGETITVDVPHSDV